MKLILLTVAVILGIATVSARDPRCPIQSGGNAIHVPHETDCRKFYKCDPDGNLVEMDCYPGTEYDPSLGVCTWPNGNCKNIFIENPPIRLAEELPEGCDPNEDPANPTHLPHPTRCDCFYKCSKGTPVLIMCPPGQHWNIPQNYCDWPENAHCVRPLP